MEIRRIENDEKRKAMMEIEKYYTDKIAILKEILAINPNIKVLATPWSAPRFKWAFAFFVDGDHSGH